MQLVSEQPPKKKSTISVIKKKETDEQDRPFVNALCGHLSSSLAMFLSD